MAVSVLIGFKEAEWKALIKIKGKNHTYIKNSGEYRKKFDKFTGKTI